MVLTIAAHFDGKVFIPDEPIPLPQGRRLKISFEAEEVPPRFAEFLTFAADLPGAPGDLSIRHDDYLSGTAK